MRCRLDMLLVSCRAIGGAQVQELFDTLLLQPLHQLQKNEKLPAGPHLIVIDALDECEVLPPTASLKSFTPVSPFLQDRIWF